MNIASLVWQILMIIGMFVSAILMNTPLTIAFGVMAILNMDIEGR